MFNVDKKDFRHPAKSMERWLSSTFLERWITPTHKQEKVVSKQVGSKGKL